MHTTIGSETVEGRENTRNFGGGGKMKMIFGKYNMKFVNTVTNV